MAIKAYIGLQGHGKTYELVSVVIYNAIKQGRRVISNIAGLNQAEFNKLILKENPSHDNIGQIISVAHDAVLNPDFWLTDATIQSERNDYQIQRGDLVVLDEIWRFWDGFARADTEGNKRPIEVMNFFRMHRHMTHPVTGVTCDLALISQDVNDFHRSLRGVIDETYRMTQLIAVGMPNRYRIDVFAKTKIVAKPVTSFQSTYEAKYFPLYQSHSLKKEGDASAKQVIIDGRGNVLKGKIFLLVFVLAILSGFAFYMLWGFFHPKPEKPKDLPNPLNEQAMSHAEIQQLPPQTVYSESWRVVGTYTLNGVLYTSLESSKGVMRSVPYPESITIVGSSINVIVDGENINNWSNQFLRSQNAPNTISPVAIN